MAGGVQGKAGHAANGIGIAIDKQPVKLAAVALKLGAFVEDLAEDVLHDGDLVADADLAAKFALDIGRGRQVVGVDMRFDDPFQRQVPWRGYRR